MLIWISSVTSYRSIHKQREMHPLQWISGSYASLSLSHPNCDALRTGNTWWSSPAYEMSYDRSSRGTSHWLLLAFLLFFSFFILANSVRRALSSPQPTPGHPPTLLHLAAFSLPVTLHLTQRLHLSPSHTHKRVQLHAIHNNKWPLNYSSSSFECDSLFYHIKYVLLQGRLDRQSFFFLFFFSSSCSFNCCCFFSLFIAHVFIQLFFPPLQGTLCCVWVYLTVEY